MYAGEIYVLHVCIRAIHAQKHAYNWVEYTYIYIYIYQQWSCAQEKYFHPRKWKVNTISINKIIFIFLLKTIKFPLNFYSFAIHLYSTLMYSHNIMHFIYIYITYDVYQIWLWLYMLCMSDVLLYAYNRPGLRLWSSCIYIYIYTYILCTVSCMHALCGYLRQW